MDNNRKSNKTEGKCNYSFGGSSLTAAPDITCIGCFGLTVVTPPAAVDLEDAIVSGSISVAVDGFGAVA